MRVRVALLAGAVLLLSAAPASAAERQVTALSFAFPPPAPVIDQGDTLTFVNQDSTTHNLTAKNSGSNGKPLFASRDVGGGSAKVEGAEFLTTGTYAFLCTIHPSMTGTLTVTSNGTPAVRPPDTTKPKLAVSFPSQKLEGIVKARRINVRATVDEPGTVAVTITAVVGKKTLTLGTAKQPFKTATARTFPVALGSSALKALRDADSVKLSASGQATDTAGNIGRAKTAKLTASR